MLSVPGLARVGSSSAALESFGGCGNKGILCSSLNMSMGRELKGIENACPRMREGGCTLLLLNGTLLRAGCGIGLLIEFGVKSSDSSGLKGVSTNSFRPAGIGGLSSGTKEGCDSPPCTIGKSYSLPGGSSSSLFLKASKTFGMGFPEALPVKTGFEFSCIVA